MNAYQSTLPPRTRPVTQADFDALPNLHGTTPYTGVTEFTQFYWNDKVFISPENLYGIFKRNFGDDVNLSIVLDRYRMNLEVRSIPEDQFEGKMLFNMEPSNLPEESNFFVNEESRGKKGFGKAWLKSIIETRLALGFDDFKFFAAGINGAYTWAKAGAVLDMNLCYQDRRQELSKSLLSRIEALKPHVPPDVFGMARALSRLTSKDDLVSLSQIDFVVPSEIHEQVKQGIATKDSALMQSLEAFYKLHPSQDLKPINNVSEQQLRMRTAFEEAARQNAPATLPRVLLTGMAWNARVDFNDAARMEKMGAYLGGWNHIEPQPYKKAPAFYASAFNP